jgi:hypothetical protein
MLFSWVEMVNNKLDPTIVLSNFLLLHVLRRNFLSQAIYLLISLCKQNISCSILAKMSAVAAPPNTTPAPEKDAGTSVTITSVSASKPAAPVATVPPGFQIVKVRRPDGTIVKVKRPIPAAAAAKGTATKDVAAKPAGDTAAKPAPVAAAPTTATSGNKPVTASTATPNPAEVDSLVKTAEPVSAKPEIKASASPNIAPAGAQASSASRVNGSEWCKARGC